MENNIVKVKLWGQEVGLLYWDKKSHKAIFEYNPAIHLVETYLRLK